MRGPVYFYAPGHERFLDFAGDFREFWPWLCARTEGKPWIGPYSWTVQTYYRLRAAGARVELVGEMPDRGVVVGHVRLLPSRIPDRVFGICIKPDKPQYHPDAWIHVLQNPAESGHLLWDVQYLQYWPQPSLIPRHPDRGTRVENVDFVGNADELAPELQETAFSDELRRRGFRWRIRSRAEWSNYGSTDVVVGVRAFDPVPRRRWISRRKPILSKLIKISRKPASKLINAWRAGTPSILGLEPAYRGTGNPGVDYIEVVSMDDIFSALNSLQSDPSLYERIVSKGRQQAAGHSPERITEDWRRFLEHRVARAHDRWRRTPRWLRRSYLDGRRHLSRWLVWMTY